jgi:multidrug resistance efflux pump
LFEHLRLTNGRVHDWLAAAIATRGGHSMLESQRVAAKLLAEMGAGQVATLAYADAFTFMALIATATLARLPIRGSAPSSDCSRRNRISASARAALRRDIAALGAARAHVAVIEAEGQQAQAAIARQRAALAQAEFNLSYTKIYAVKKGTVANKTVEVGNFVQSEFGGHYQVSHYFL